MYENCRRIVLSILPTFSLSTTTMTGNFSIYSLAAMTCAPSALTRYALAQVFRQASSTSCLTWACSETATFRVCPAHRRGDKDHTRQCAESDRVDHGHASAGDPSPVRQRTTILSGTSQVHSSAETQCWLKTRRVLESFSLNAHRISFFRACKCPEERTIG